MIKAVIFDLDDTLYDCLHNDHKSIKEQLSSWDMAAQHNRVLYIQKMLEILGVSPFKYAIDIYNYFWNDFLNRIELFPGALDFLKHLKDLGIKTEICQPTYSFVSLSDLE